MRKLTLTTLLTLLLSASPLLAAESREITPDLHVISLGHGIWRHVSAHELEHFGRVEGNGLIVVSDGEAAVVDTPWTDAETAALFDWIESELGAKVTAVVPTHSHGDCLGGLAEAHRRGAASYSLTKTAEFAREAGVEVPRETFDVRLEIEVGGRRLVLRHVGGGHTVDNIVVHVPDAELLFGGCLVRSATSKQLGYTAEADLDGWPTTIELLRTDYADALIVPGHGRPGGVELFENTLRLLHKHKGEE